MLLLLLLLPEFLDAFSRVPPRTHPVRGLSSQSLVALVRSRRAGCTLGNKNDLFSKIAHVPFCRNTSTLFVVCRRVLTKVLFFISYDRVVVVCFLQLCFSRERPYSVDTYPKDVLYTRVTFLRVGPRRPRRSRGEVKQIFIH